MHDQWTDRLSEYLDDELGADERQALEVHLAGCAGCARTLEELRRVVVTAESLTPHVPGPELWQAVAGRLGADSRRLAPFSERRFSFTIPQLAAASLVIAALSGGMVWRARTPPPQTGTMAGIAAQMPAGSSVDDAIPDVAPASFAGAQ